MMPRSAAFLAALAALVGCAQLQQLSPVAIPASLDSPVGGGGASAPSQGAARAPSRSSDPVARQEGFVKSRVASAEETPIEQNIQGARAEIQKLRELGGNTAPYEKRLQALTAKAHFESWVDTQRRDFHFWQEKLSSQQGHFADDAHCKDFAGDLERYDYSAVMRTIDERLAADASHRQNTGIMSNVDELRAMKPGFDKYGEFVASEATSLVDGTWKAKKDGDLFAARFSARQGIALVESGLKLAPENAKLKQHLDTLRKAQPEIESAIDKLYSGPFHKANLNKIVFSNAPLETGKENPSLVKAAFRADEPLYATAYLELPLGDASGKLILTFSEEDKEVASFEWGVARGPDGTGKMVFPIEVAPVTEKATFPAQGARLARELSELAPRKHAMKVHLSFHQNGQSSSGGVADGELELDTGAGVETMAATGAALLARVIRETRMPKPALKDAALHKQIMAAIPAAGWKETPLRVVLTDSDWTLYRNRVTSIVVSRDIGAAVAVKTVDGGCRYFNLRFYQNAVGGGFSKAELATVYLAHDMDCGNVDK